MADFSHIDNTGKAVMVDVSQKERVRRTAVARGRVRLKPETLDALRGKLLSKGDALGCARIAGICAAKKTSELIPLCHNIPLEHVGVDLEIGDDAVLISATATASGKTGVEMEALTAVSLAALTIYDMCKALDKDMVIEDICLVHKHKERTAD